jgi:hypothetical protein
VLPPEPFVVAPLDPLLELAEEHDSLTVATPALTGSAIDESGVPGGTLTVKDSFCPVTRVTVTTHVSAEATGIAARPETARTDPAATAAATRFRLFSTLAFLLPAFSRRRL